MPGYSFATALPTSVASVGRSVTGPERARTRRQIQAEDDARLQRSYLVAHLVRLLRASHERRQLEEQQKGLRAKIESLKSEQDFLLFRKEFYGADSKYLVLHIPAGKGELRYKNRLIKSFSFTPSSESRVRAVPVGPATVTKKVENRGKPHDIIFGSSFLLKVKPKDVRPSLKDGAAPPRLFVSKRDMQSLFYAVEDGSKAYILQ